MDLASRNIVGVKLYSWIHEQLEPSTQLTILTPLTYKVKKSSTITYTGPYAIGIAVGKGLGENDSPADGEALALRDKVGDKVGEALGNWLGNVRFAVV